MEYVRASEEPMLQEVATNTVECEPKVDYKRRMSFERKARLTAKKLHRSFFNDVKEVGSDKSWQWLHGGYLYEGTEGFISAAQEKVVYNRDYCANVMNQEIDDTCRMCG